jgi:hypothetical protein
MTPKSMAFWQARVIKIVGRQMRHPEPLHHPA